MKHLIAFLLLPFCIHAHAATDAWTDVLSQAGLTKADVHFDPLDLQMGGGADLQGSFFKTVLNEPLRIPYYARLYRDAMLGYAKEPYKVGVSSLSRLDLGVRRTLGGDPLESLAKMSTGKDALVAAIAQIHKLGGVKSLMAAQKEDIRKRAKNLSAETYSTLAFMIAVEAQAMEWRTRAFSALDKAFLSKAYAERIEAPKREDQDDNKGLTPIMRRLVRDVDLTVLMAGGGDLILGVQKTREKLATLKENENFEWTTPLGAIVLRGGTESNTYHKNYLLVIDGGGDDTYLSGGGSSLTLPVSVILDLKGNDKYLAKAGLNDAHAADERKAATVTPSFGAGVFGYGVLVDAEGDDVYRSFRQAQGRADFGVGLLWDLGGKDTYDCWTQGQGSAEFGSGVLIDGGGEDSYMATYAAQGFGGTAGAGVLLDAGADKDSFIGNDTQIDFPSLIDKAHNVSFVQGAALGWRADGSDGHGLAAGFGALVDGGGDNAFKAGFFAQGIAYWYGVGWLSVGAGRDSYEAAKYAQGAATHFGVGILHDSGGDDSYKVAQELGIGHGHDLAVGFLLEDGGNDTYVAPNFSLGCSSAQGMGFFWDRSGDDTYTTESKQVFGCANLRIETPSFRVTSRTLGVFLDTGGKNEFKSPIKELNGRKSSERWSTNTEFAPKDLAPRMLARLKGVARVVNAPDTEDPY